MFRQSSPSFTAFLFAAINLAVFVTTVDPQRPGEQIMELYMQDILRSNSQTARPITGLPTSTAGQVLFARPLGFRPPKDGVAIPNANGAIPTVNINGVPLGTGLAGTSFAGGNKNSQTVTNQLSPDGLGLAFGTSTVIDDILTSSPEIWAPKTLAKLKESMLQALQTEVLR